MPSTPTLPGIKRALAVDTVAALRATRAAGSFDTVTLRGFYAAGDGGGGPFRWDSASTATDDGGTIVQVTGVTTGRWRRIFDGGSVSVLWFGAVPGASTAAARTTAFQAALDWANAQGGGRVYLPDTGTALVLSDRLKVYSDTEVELQGRATLKMDDAQNVILLRNANRSIDPDTITDRNITIRGGVWDGNGANNGGYSVEDDKLDPLAGTGGNLCFVGVAGLKIVGIESKDAAIHGIQLANCTDWLVSDITLNCPTTADGVHVGGNCRRFVIRNITGSTADDFVALNAIDWVISTPMPGDITDGEVSGLYPTTCGASVLKLLAGGGDASYFGGAGGHVRRISAYDIRGGTGTTDIYLRQDTDQDTPAHTYDSIGVIEDVTIDGVTCRGILTIRIANHLKNVKINNVVVPAAQNDNVVIVDALTQQGHTTVVESLTLAGWRVETPTAAAGVITLNGRVDHLQMSGWQATDASGFGRILLNVRDGATLGVAELRDCFVNFPNQATAAVYLGGTGVVKDVRIAGGRWVGGNASGEPAIDVAGTSTVGMVTLTGVTFDDYRTGVWRNQRSSALQMNGNRFVGCTTIAKCEQAAEIVLTGNRFEGVLSTIVDLRTAAVTVTVTESANRSTNIGFANLFRNAGTVRWIGTSLPVDSGYANGPVTNDVLARSDASNRMARWTGAAWVDI